MYSKNLHAVTSPDPVSLIVEEVGCGRVALKLRDEEGLGFGGVDLHSL